MAGVAAGVCVEREERPVDAVLAQAVFHADVEGKHGAVGRGGIAGLAGKVEGPEVEASGGIGGLAGGGLIAVDQVEDAPAVAVGVVAAEEEWVEEVGLRGGVGVFPVEVKGAEPFRVVAGGEGLAEEEGADELGGLRGTPGVGVGDADGPVVALRGVCARREGGGEAEAGDGGAEVHGWQCERRTGKIVPRARAKVGSPDA